MYWTEWIKILFSGFAGSVVGLIGAVIAVFIGRWLERRHEKETQLRQQAGELTALVFNIQFEDSTREFNIGLIQFAVAANPRFPRLADWCLERQRQILEAKATNNKESFLEELSNISTTLLFWSSEKLKDLPLAKNK